MSETPLLKVKNLQKHYPVQKLFGTAGTIKALGGVSFSLKEGETLAIVGESGCGKSTLAKVLMQIEGITDGTVEINGHSSLSVNQKEFRQFIQMIFQDPYGSLNPRKKVWKIISDPLRISGQVDEKICRKRAQEMMERVGLRPEYADRYPHMFSGGQRQRIGVARALVLQPKVLICDEPVSALDVSVQAQVINLLMDLQDELNLSYLFISHDLSVVRHLADRVLVLYFGKVAEYGSVEEIFSSPQHPYTQVLLGSTPKIQSSPDQKKELLSGELPSPLSPPSGCSFHTRCSHAMPVCREIEPRLVKVKKREVACHLYQDDPNEVG